jgi:hypothetical protein
LSGTNDLKFGTLLRRRTASGLDAMVCAVINGMQWKLRKHVCTQEEFDTYLSACEPVSRDEFYRVPTMPLFVRAGNYLEWPSPVKTLFPENQTARARIFLSDQGFGAPTLIFLHALMSAYDTGYCRIAAGLNRRGWNAALIHLPYHYSRVPRGHFNGALAITANLAQNGETLRQAVIEVRQLMEFFRQKGCPEFGLLGTSYGGWVGSLVSFLEKEFRFVSLLQPIVDIEHAIWYSPVSSVMRRTLLATGIGQGMSRRHAHLTSPLDGQPLCGGDRVLVVGGTYDSISPPAELKQLATVWPGSRLILVEQGHFGYSAMREALRWIDTLL